MFQIVVRPGKIRNIIAEEKSWPVAVGNLEKGGHHLLKGFRWIGFLSYLIKQRLVVLLYLIGRLLFSVGEQVCCSMDPLISGLHIGPQGSSCG